MKPEIAKLARELSKEYREGYDRWVSETIIRKRYGAQEIPEAAVEREKHDAAKGSIEEKLAQEGILKMEFRYNPEKGVQDRIIGKIKKEGFCVNKQGAAYEWYVVSINNEDFIGSDLFYNHGNSVPWAEDGYRIKYFTDRSRIVFLEDHVRSYFADMFDNWKVYENALKIRSVQNLNSFQRKRLKASAVRGLMEEANKAKNPREHFIGKAAEDYISSFMEKQESLRIGNPFSNAGVKAAEVYVSAMHLLDASPEMRYLVVADLLERGCTPCLRKEQEVGIKSIIGRISVNTINKYKNMEEDPAVFESAANAALEKLFKKRS